MQKKKSETQKKKKKKPAAATSRKASPPVKKAAITPRETQADPMPKDFLDVIAPGAVRFNTDYYILGNSYRSVFALRGYPTSTEELALLQHLGAKSRVTLSIYVRQVTPAQ
jgi:hypothetical protein